MTENVLFSTYPNGLAAITLNRPKAINALSFDMLQAIQKKLTEWEQDDAVQLILLTGAGSKGFCAGGDIKALYEAHSNDTELEKADQFFEEEYDTDWLVYRYHKPIIACLDGIVMGGGVGLIYGASHRIVTERTKWAMPEMNIGFFPDVGAAYFFNKAPGATGRYLALTASTIGASDAIAIHAADYYLPSGKLNSFIADVQKTDWHNEALLSALNHLLTKYAEPPEVKSALAPLRETIDRHFSYSTVEEIAASLEADDSEFASRTRDALLSKSAVSLKVALKQILLGKNQSFKACLETDLTIARHFLRHEDFFEGIRSVLIDKDRQPNYRYKNLSDVSEERVDHFFDL